MKLNGRSFADRAEPKLARGTRATANAAATAAAVAANDDSAGARHTAAAETGWSMLAPSRLITPSRTAMAEQPIQITIEVKPAVDEKGHR